MRYAFTLILALGLAMPAGAQQSAAEAARLEANKQVLMKFFALGGDLEARKKMLTDDYIQHNPRFVELTGSVGSQAWFDAINMARGRIRAHSSIPSSERRASSWRTRAASPTLTTQSASR